MEVSCPVLKIHLSVKIISKVSVKCFKVFFFYLKLIFILSCCLHEMFSYKEKYFKLQNERQIYSFKIIEGYIFVFLIAYMT